MKAFFSVVLPILSFLLMAATLTMQLIEMKFYEMF
jgi:hypothetical protein